MSQLIPSHVGGQVIAGALGLLMSLLTPSVLAAIDYSDSPDKYGAASHAIVSTLSLGNTVTADSSSLGSTTADNDSDDGLYTDAALTQLVKDNSIPRGTTLPLYASIKGSGKLYAWVDWNNDGVMGNTANELVVNGVSGNNQALNFNLTPPGDAKFGVHYIRLRFSSDSAAANPAGSASNGEVEDYRFFVDWPLAGVSNPAVESCTNTWTAIAGGAESTTAQGLKVTINTTALTDASWVVGANNGNDSLNANGVFQSALLNGTPAYNLTYYWDTSPEIYTDSKNDGKTGTIKFTFSQPVLNPIMHIDRLGGAADAIAPAVGHYSSSSLWSPNNTNSSLSFKRLAGVDHFQVTSNSMYRTLEPLTSQNGESGTDHTNSMAMGSVQLNGLYTSATLNVSPSGPDGMGADGFKLVICSNSDFGDAPGYSEAAHRLSSNVYLGQAPDGELASKTASADASNDAYDDGVFTNSAKTTSLQNAIFTRAVPQSLTIPVVGAGKLFAWFDWDGDGTFGNNANELVANGLIATNSNLSLLVTPPTAAKSGITYARFRLVSDLALTNLSPSGLTASGEVEDYQLTIASPEVYNCPTSNASDGIASTGTGLYKTNINWLNWSCGNITQFNVGDTVNKSWDLGNGIIVTGQITNITEALALYTSGTASTDKLNNLYGGMTNTALSNAVVSGSNSPDPKFDLVLSAKRNGNAIGINIVAADAEDTAGTNEALTLTTNGQAFEVIEYLNNLNVDFANTAKTLTLSDLNNSGAGTVLALSDNVSTLNVSMQTAAKQAVAFGVALGYDFGDAPSSYGNVLGHYIPMTSTSGSKPTATTATSILSLASLTSKSNYYLGSVKPDSEASTLASDDTTGVDDEEGVTIPALKAGRPITITAKATGSNGYLQAWIDWNRDGDFVDINERIATNVQDNSPQDSNNAVGTIGLTLTPSTLISGTSYARFRWSDQNGLNHMALAGEGEVEDYAVTLSNNAIPVITSNGGGMSASMSLPEKQTTVTTVTATDADSDTLTYSIAGGTDSTKFAINASTGVLSFINVPSFVSPQDSDGNNVYDLKVSVSDGFGGVDTQDIAVSITQVIDYVKLSVRVLLQGTEFATGLMTDTLRARKLIPTAQPYTKAPFNYMGTETVSTARLAETGNSAMVDWVLVELRDATDPKIIISQQAAVLERDGDISVPNTGATTLLFSGVYPNTYYVAVRHRNHIAVMTQSALALTNTTRAVDFTLFSTITYGFDGRYILNSTAFMWAGEANQDQFIIANGPDNDTSSVLSLVLMNPDNKLYNSNYILTGYKNADINMDGDVVFAGPENDLNIITANVLLFPSNKTFSGNYVVKGNLP